MGMHTLPSGAYRGGFGAFEIAILCACKHRDTERESGEPLQAWASGSVSEYLAAFRQSGAPEIYDAFVVPAEAERAAA